ncbi:hypothetical protein JX265_012920 [Neoarthrinium moseri]|uniref:Histidine kinase n=1 Tax=Neoarthrinium moseri TaxID=1658444 RepID=A0A9P9W9F9_9PEZI|nr:hypothetical protein JX266_006983 [Neoarthrinium moseri]KAI1852892.1 hypothetical protein JX265_012920 [Neoarthrinium moseri]
MRSNRSTSSSTLASHGGDDGSGRQTLPDLWAFLDADLRPTFLVPINELGESPFELLFCNESLRCSGLDKDILRGTNAAGQFRAWCQVVVHWRDEYSFAGKTWSAFKIQGRWKCIRETNQVPANGLSARSEYQNAHAGLVGSEKIDREDVKIAHARIASLNKMMEMSDVGTFEYTPEGKLIRANESWYRLSLHPNGEDRHADFSFMDLVYPPDAPLVLSQWNKLAQGIPVTFEMRWKGENYRKSLNSDEINDVQWVLSACVPIQDEDGNLVSIAGNTIDINAQKRVQEEALQRAEALERARKSERKFSRFALLAPIAIYILDSHGKMTYCNNRFFELTGHPSASDYPSIDWQHLVFPEDQPILDNQWKTLLHDKKRVQAHFRLKHTWDLGDGTLRQAWIESQAFPELDHKGNVVSIFATMTDISRFKWAEQIQRTRIKEALEAKQKHENFIDMTSHEMRNPLSAVIQCADSTCESLKGVLGLISKPRLADIALKQRLDDEIQQCLDSLNTIISCSIHQKRVIDDVLTLSKMDSNLLAISPVRAEPAAIVSEAVHMFELECNKDDIDLRFLEDPSLLVLGAQYVMMDPSRVLQILINLLTNAIKFTRDRPTRQIEVSLGACMSPPSDGFHQIPFASVTTDSSGLLEKQEWGTGRELYIWIQCRDTGCGLSTEEQGNLFTRFQQATPRTHIRYGGSGLGLFISKKLAELQGGAIGVRSEPNVGSTFAFFVATRTAQPTTPLAVDSIHELSLRRTSSAGLVYQDEPHYSVLIVEDNVVNQKVLSQQLRKVGCRVYVSNHGREALDFIRTTEYWASEGRPAAPIRLSVILMDIEMPVMDGLACTRRIRNYQQTGHIVKHIPIMAVSANARSEQVAQAKDAGVDDAISKPFRIPELMPKIEALVRSDRCVTPPPMTSRPG